MKKEPTDNAALIRKTVFTALLTFLFLAAVGIGCVLAAADHFAAGLVIIGIGLMGWSVGIIYLRRV